ncbi:MAG: hypothetical protein NC401_17665, partial [Ruminococcus sp.]|nr:hypothetical protein [Ruminococcus sp.]
SLGSGGAIHAGSTPVTRTSAMSAQTLPLLRAMGVFFLCKAVTKIFFVSVSQYAASGRLYKAVRDFLVILSKNY